MHVMIMCGCGASFKRSGLHSHRRQSSDPRCHHTFQRSSDSQARHNELDFNLDGTLDDAFDIDRTGDFFGDYDDYSLEEFGLESTEQMGKASTHGDHEIDSDNEDTDDQPEDIQLEPKRVPPNFNDAASQSIKVEDNACSMDTESAAAFRIRGGAEAELENKPYIVKFSQKSNTAGRTYQNANCIDENTSYTAQISNTANTYSPFRSKLEWEIALWAKTRGPSSTAFTELMSIEGVREHEYTFDSLGSSWLIVCLGS